MMYRIFTLWILVITAPLPVAAQYIPNSSQGFQYASVYNPAFTGAEAYGDLKIGYRYQWTGFGDNAPRFMNLAYNFRLRQPLSLTQNTLRTSVPYEEGNVPRRKHIVHGLGVNFFKEEVPAIDRIGGGISYSFHYPLSVKKNVRLATGFSVMLDNTRVNADEVYLGADADPDPFYDNLVNNGASRTDLNVRAGLLVYAPSFYIGACYLPVFTDDLGTSPLNTGDNLFYRGTAQAGVSFPLGASVELKPSVLGVLQADDELLFDYNLKMFIRQRVLLGFTYRDIKSMVGLVGFNVNELIMMSYTYEVSTNEMRQFSDGSHELVLSLRLNNSGHFNPYIW